ncbi:YkvA family protein [Lentibacillus sediminis]|uniref:YkvA family protein n=1 Tax=Lentibacillus sediminis TaxID=1940529 RepID=UPI000C1BBBE0|nr:DUF1232 domain-containing protein [Lentibacillus sediminis]
MYRFFRRMRFLFTFRKSIPFAKDFFLSHEVTKGKKGLFAALLLGYVLFPFDVIPDFLLMFGILDDIAVVTFLLQQMVKAAPDSLKEKHQLFE